MTIELSARKGPSMLIDQPDIRRGFLKYVGGAAVRRVRLVLLLLVGPREGENDFLEFPSVEDAVIFGRLLRGDPKFQLEGIEDHNGKSLMSYDDLNYLCGAPHS